MKRFSSSDSLGALISICPPKDCSFVNVEDKRVETNSHGYSKEFQAMLDSLDQEDCGEEFVGKKRRLSSDQVKALERNFELENKLEPERKAKLAEELGLQPRQVAIWFQNRRARWKTKQLEKDYGILKANYEALKLDFENLQQQNGALSERRRELKEKVYRGSEESSQSVKEESPISVQENIDKGGKDGSSESDSNGVLKEEGKVNFSLGLNGSSSSSTTISTGNWFHISDSRAFPVKVCQPQFTRMEEHTLFSSEGSCNFFSVDQAPTLHWYFPEQ
ncbi:hypothetical protein UlMin_035133 [Ulmus minor]